MVAGGVDDLSIMVCDVSGHGISAALVANRIYTELIGELQRGTELVSMLRDLNGFMMQSVGHGTVLRHPGRCAVETRRSRAGICRRWASTGDDRAARRVTATAGIANLMLGLFENAVASQATVEVPLQGGDRVVMYTDGFIESFNAQQDMLGVEGLSEIVREASTRPLAEMKQHILDRVAAWRCGPAADDMSLVVVSIDP
jgi:phosphoserine phosphatase RsbU/P